VIQPPRVGPSVGATMIPSRKIACTSPCCSRGKIWRIVAWAVDRSAAPPAPCRMRQTTSSVSELEVPQKKDATMKMMMDVVR